MRQAIADMLQMSNRFITYWGTIKRVTKMDVFLIHA